MNASGASTGRVQPNLTSHMRLADRSETIVNPRLLLLALLCLFALPAGASAQPFWPDPEEAYPYAPEESHDRQSEDWAVQPPSKPSTLTLSVTPMPVAGLVPSFSNISDAGEVSIAQPHIESRMTPGENATRFDLVFQAKPRADQLPSTVRVQIQARDKGGRIVGSLNVSSSRMTSLGRSGWYQAHIATLRCPETDGEMSCADETSEMEQEIMRAATPAPPSNAWSPSRFTSPSPASRWEYREEDEWERNPEYDDE